MSIISKIKFKLKNTLVYAFLGPLYKRFVTIPRTKRKIIQFQKNALTVVSDLDTVLTQNNIEYYLMWGSMLGAIREHGFIKHDFDFDISIFIDEIHPDKLQPLLENNDFFLEHDLKVDNGNFARHQCYIKNKVGIDIFWFFYDSDNKPYTCLYKSRTGDSKDGVYPIVSKFPFSRKAIRVPFETLHLPVPQNAHQIMKIIYGNDYMTPIPPGKYKPPRDPRYHYLRTDKIGYIIEYHID